MELTQDSQAPGGVRTIITQQAGRSLGKASLGAFRQTSFQDGKCCAFGEACAKEPDKQGHIL